MAGYDLIHAIHIGLVYSAEIALAAAQARGLPFVFTPFPHQGGWEGRRFRRLYSSSDALIAMTHTEKEWLADRGAVAKRVHVCGGGPVLADTSSGGRFRERFHLTGPIVLFVGQRLKHKGYAELIAAMPTVWAQHSVVQFVFIGPMTPEAQPIFAEATKDSRVIDLGMVDVQTKTDALDACAMLCVPSTQESLGLVYIEAWARGKPVIAGDIPITREVIDPEIDGLLVPQRPDAIAGAINQLLDTPLRAEQMGRLGFRKMTDRYSWDTVTQKVDRLYSTLVMAS